MMPYQSLLGLSLSPSDKLKCFLRTHMVARAVSVMAYGAAKTAAAAAAADAASPSLREHEDTEVDCSTSVLLPGTAICLTSMN